ncbi:FAD-dependent oxidoreductase [Nocardia pseudovaccinii]|uniref:FAD-dependent oxidoreductase n=1 Tax=Nocardia pseudovaccinii TaxID=189540 RepID=UPI0007A513AB|nr:FAD-dependent oxidoreductase [Nocardia pseudovaccinii]
MVEIVNAPLPDSVAIIGAGFIGCSFAAVFVRRGVRVRLFDAAADARSSADGRIAGMLAQTGDEANLDLVSVHADLDSAVAGVSWVQECVAEDLSIKRDVFRALDQRCAPSVILASSASELTMTAISDGLVNPQRCIVVHPTNPPHLLRFVEVVPGAKTDRQIVDTACAVMTALGQVTASLAKEVPGFLLNRLQVALEREAFALLTEGVATVADIDAAIAHGLGPRWAAIGPFAVEETNSMGIEAGLTRFRGYFNNMFAALDRPFDGIDDGFVALAVKGVAAAYGRECRDELLARRDNILLALRNHKG